MSFTLTLKSFDYRNILFDVDKISLLCNTILVILGSLLIAIGAKICVPLQPVPVTLETLAVLFIAMTYGFRLGTLAILTYLGAGLAGLPIYTIPHPAMTAGYLFGFLLAGAATGFLAERGWASHVFSTIIATLLGSVLILLSGWIALSQFLGISAAFNVGIKPFLLGDCLKIIFLAFVIPSFWRSVNKA